MFYTDSLKAGMLLENVRVKFEVELSKHWRCDQNLLEIIIAIEAESFELND